jgi:hypothetical protein
MFPTFAKIAAVTAGLAILAAAFAATPSRGLKGLFIAVVIAAAAAFLITMARGFAP